MSKNWVKGDVKYDVIYNVKVGIECFRHEVRWSLVYCNKAKVDVKHIRELCAQFAVADH
jgi:hypothetical protein